MADKGTALNRKVWRLFDRAGFSTQPNARDPAEEEVTQPGGGKRTFDLSAIDTELGIKIIGWNKSRPNLSESLSVHINDYSTLMGRAKADAGLMVSAEKDFTDADRELARGYKITLWNREELEYYGVLVDAIGKYARFEIIHSMGIETKEERKIVNLPALRFQQPVAGSRTDLYLFTATPSLLLRTCVVLRRAQGNQAAYQRILQKKRLAKIGEFVGGDNALLPPNIIVHLGDVNWEPIDFPSRTSHGKPTNLTKAHACEVGVLSIQERFGSMELIDGQHRLFGFVAAQKATRDSFNLVVLGLSNIDAVQRVSSFIVINDLSRRIDPNLVTFLKYNDNEVTCQANHAMMATKVVIQLSKTSPFEKRIRILDIGNMPITLKGFAGYDLKGLVGPRGQLRKHYENTSVAYTRVLRLYFGLLKSTFPSQWKEPNKYIMFTNRGITAFLKLLRSILKTEDDALTQKSISKYLRVLKKEWPDESFETSKLKNSYVGAQGWKQFHRDLVASIRRSFKGFVE